jgi:hypothetical protein
MLSKLPPGPERAVTSVRRDWSGTGVLWFGQQYDRLRQREPVDLITRASLALRHVVTAEPRVAADAALHRCQARMLDAVRLLPPGPLRRRGFSSLVTSRRLQAGANSAYQLMLIG